MNTYEFFWVKFDFAVNPALGKGAIAECHLESPAGGFGRHELGITCDRGINR